MTDLDTLRPEVREAMTRLERYLHITIGGKHFRENTYDIIRTELLRLTDDCARLVDCINAQPPTRRRLIDRAERAEAELAALKQREQDAATALVPKVPTSAMLDAAVALALNVTVHGAGGWSNYMRDVWGAMLAAQEHDDGR